VSTADFDDLFKLLCLDVESVAKFDEGGKEVGTEFGHGCYVHCRWESRILVDDLEYGDFIILLRVVAALAHVNMVIRMNRLLRSKFSS